MKIKKLLKFLLFQQQATKYLPQNFLFHNQQFLIKVSEDTTSGGILNQKILIKRRGQISTEYLIIVGFVVFLVLSVLGIAFFYTSGIRDTVRHAQVETFVEKLISSAETVFFAGEPSQKEFIGYLPSGVNSIQLNGKNVIINYTTSSGENFVAFESDVEIQGTISSTSGIKKFELKAQQDKVVIINP